MSPVSAVTGQPQPEAVLRVIQNFWLGRAVYVAAKLGLADLLRDGPKFAEELAKSTGTHVRSLYRLLRALASEGWFAQDDKDRFELTAQAAALRSDVPASMRFFAMAELGEEHYPAWAELLYSVKTGKTAFDHVFGMPPWDFFREHPENAEIFNRAMANVTAITEKAVLESYDFSGICKLVDVGGGNGSLMAAILRAYPEMRGVVFDLPHVAEEARSRMAAEGLDGRCEIIAGNFFDGVPTGGEAYVLKWIIHDWEDDRAVKILENCRHAMTDSGKLLMIESVLPPGNQPFFHKFMDLNMLVMTGGCERTEAEFRRLFEKAGLRVANIAATSVAETTVIEGVK